MGLHRYRERRDFSRTKQIIISSPERLVWPSLEIRKIDLVRYAEEVGEWFLPHLRNRPLTLVRCPDGAEAKCFYQRHQRGSKDYMRLSTLDEVLGAVQNGAVEFHTWGATAPDVKHPDRITLDLDPGPGLPWAKLLEAARLAKKLLDGLKLESFLKTTGGKGLHIVAPIAPELCWDAVKQFTKDLAGFLVRARPDLFVANMAKSKRGGKVFVDYLRNAETASAVAAYSPRARAEAGVSTPVSWDDLGRKDIRRQFTVKSVPRRLKRLGADPWADYAKAKQSITPAMLKALRT
jgi:bifunctional non-homologous end joining protein LigD